MSYTNVHHSFDINLAENLKSVELAILVHHFSYWIDINTRKKINFHDGKVWMYQTIDKMVDHFPYWSSDQISRYIKKLIKKKILIKGNYNKTRFDRTVWYTFHSEFSKTSNERRNREMEIAKSSNGDCEIAEPIPYNKTDTKTDNPNGSIEAAPTPAPDPKPKFKRQPKTKRAEHVHTTDHEHEKLTGDLGEDLVTQCYEYLNEWKQDTAKSKWKKDDNRSIRRWVIDALKEQKSRRSKGKGSPGINDHQKKRNERYIKNNPPGKSGW